VGIIRKALNYLRFTRSEQLSLAILCLILVFVNLAKLKFGENPTESLLMIADTIRVFGGEHNVSFANKPDNEIEAEADQGKYRKKEPVEINQADSSDLLELYGIGPVFASRIVKFRNLLGGFYKPEQLLEVYGMDSARYIGFIERIRIDTSTVIKLNLNTAGFRDLLRHPYLDYDEVKSIVRYRDMNGPFLSPGQIWNDSVIQADKKDMLNPYLKVK